jgi:hypothetical protein
MERPKVEQTHGRRMGASKVRGEATPLLPSERMPFGNAGAECPWLDVSDHQVPWCTGTAADEAKRSFGMQRPVGIRGCHFFSQAQPSPKSPLQFRN